MTDTEFGRGYNRVGGLDVSLRRGKHSWSATGLATTSRSPEGDQRHERRSGGQASYSYESKRFVFVEPARALRPRLPDGHRVPQPDRHHRRLGLHRGELLPRREEAPLAEAHRALRVLARPPRRDPGRRRVVRAARAPDALHPPGLLPGGHGMGTGALGPADLHARGPRGSSPRPRSPAGSTCRRTTSSGARSTTTPPTRSWAARARCTSRLRFQPSSRFNQSTSWNHVSLRSPHRRAASTTSTSSTRRPASSSTATSRRAPSSSTTARGKQVLTDLLGLLRAHPRDRRLPGLRLVDRAAGMGRARPGRPAGATTPPRGAASSSRRPTSTASEAPPVRPGRRRDPP